MVNNNGDRTLPEANSEFVPENRPKIAIIHFQGRKISKNVSFREGKSPRPGVMGPRKKLADLDGL